MVLTIHQVQPDGILVRTADQGFLGNGDLRRSRFADICLKNVFPYRAPSGSRAYVLDINYGVLEILIEDARLDLYRRQGAGQIILQAGQRRGGLGSHENAVAHGQQPRAKSKRSNDPNKAVDAHAGGAHGGNFAIGRHAAQPNQDAHQHSHGDSHSQSFGKNQKRELSNAGDRRGVAHQKFEKLAHVSHENDEREHGDPDQAVGEYFLQDVARKNAHGFFLRKSNRCASMLLMIAGNLCLLFILCFCGTCTSRTTRTL